MFFRTSSLRFVQKELLLHCPVSVERFFTLAKLYTNWCLRCVSLEGLLRNANNKANENETLITEKNVTRIVTHRLVQVRPRQDMFYSYITIQFSGYNALIVLITEPRRY